MEIRNNFCSPLNPTMDIAWLNQQGIKLPIDYAKMCRVQNIVKPYLGASL